MSDPLARWRRAAADIPWDEQPDELYVPDGPHGRWLVGGRLNLSHALLDRHLEEHGDRPAILWEGEPGDRESRTYAELHADTVTAAAALAELGVGPGDRVAVYAGLTLEAVTALLACARLGAVWCVLPSVLPVDALSARLQELRPKVLVTQDGAWRHGVVLPLKARADEALTAVGSVEHTVVVRRAGIDVAWYEGDLWWHELVAEPATDAPRASVPADAPALVTHVANRRSRPAAVVHRTAGLLAYVHELHARALGLGPGEVSWVPAEFGWIAAQTQGILGPLSTGGTALVYEGMLDTPGPDRAWQLVERHGVDVLIATPSVARAVRRLAGTTPDPARVGSLRAIVTAGEPLDDDTRRWLRKDVGRGQLQVSDAWGQTELGGLVSLMPTLEGASDPPDPGLEIVDPAGEPLPPDTVGDLVLTQPWPASASALDPELSPPGVDPARPGLFVTGDRARRRGDGSIEFLGRSDRVLNVSGQLVSAAEVTTTLEEHPLVDRAVVVDRPDRRTGRAVVACVVPREGVTDAAGFAAELTSYVREMLGGLSQPRSVVLLDAWPTLGADELIHTLAILCADAPPVSRLTARRVVAAATAARS
jgi:acetyl-CoA synthetase